MKTFISGFVVSLAMIGAAHVAHAETAAEWAARMATLTGGTVINPAPGVYVGASSSGGGVPTVTVTANPGTGTVNFTCNFAVTPPVCVRVQQ